MVVDALGNPLAFSLTGGQVHDITQAETLTAKIQAEALLADKGYRSDKYVASLEVRAIKPVIPPKANRKVKRDCDFALYAERNLVERFFQFIKQFRGIATRYEKDRPQFPRSIATRLRAGLAQIRTRPRITPFAGGNTERINCNATSFSWPWLSIGNSMIDFASIAESPPI